MNCVTVWYVEMMVCHLRPVLKATDFHSAIETLRALWRRHTEKFMSQANSQASGPHAARVLQSLAHFQRKGHFQSHLPRAP